MFPYLLLAGLNGPVAELLGKQFDSILSTLFHILTKDPGEHSIVDDNEFPFGTESIVKVHSLLLSVINADDIKIPCHHSFGKYQAHAEIPECHEGCNADN